MSEHGQDSLSTKILRVVGLALVITLAPLIAWTFYQERAEIHDRAEQQAFSTLDMLESVHVNSMLYRKQTEDNDPAIDTLNGTMAQFSEQSKSVNVWLVMSQKVIAFQKAHGQMEIEGPQDSVDWEAIRTGKTVSRQVDGNKIRVTRPVILGEGSASDKKCFACHGDLMGIEKGETFGAYSAEVDISPALLGWKQNAIINAVATVAIVLTILGIIYGLLIGTIVHPLNKLTAAAEALATGRTDEHIAEPYRSDVFGKLARALLVIRETRGGASSTEFVPGGPPATPAAQSAGVGNGPNPI